MLWCNRESNPTNWAGPLPSLEMVAEGRVFASPDILRFRDPDSFVAGNLTTCLDQWDQISVRHDKRNFVLAIISNGVDVFDFFTLFNGTFQGKTYCSKLPPRMCFPNSVACHPFKEFITASIKDRICNSSIDVDGRVGEVEPPHLLLPITVEPRKPRMCHDERFINCWIKYCLLSWIILRISATMSTLGIIRLRLTIKAATIIFVFILADLLSLVFNGRVSSLHTPVSLSGGKLALLCTTLLARPLPISLHRLVGQLPTFTYSGQCRHVHFLQLSVGSNGGFHRQLRRCFPRVLH